MMQTEYDVVANKITWFSSKKLFVMISFKENATTLIAYACNL